MIIGNKIIIINNLLLFIGIIKNAKHTLISYEKNNFSGHVFKKNRRLRRLSGYDRMELGRVGR